MEIRKMSVSEVYNYCELLKEDNRKLENRIRSLIKDNKKVKSNWNELKNWLEKKLEYANTYISNQNCKPQGDLGMQYYKAEIDKWRLEKVLSKMQSLEEGGNNE